MEFRDLKKQYEQLKPKIDKSILDVASKCNFISGEEVTGLEKALADYVGVKECISCANGTDALSMALMAWGIGSGDAVFVPDFTFFASAEVVSFEGATPVFVDVDADTFNIDPLKLEEAINITLQKALLKPRAVITVDLFGLPANYPEIEKIAKKYNLLILEDGAQGFGGAIGTRKVGSFGDISTTSFFPAKPLGCYGDGGAIFCNDDKTIEFLKSIRVHGKGSFKYDNIRIGWNSRLDTIQAAILLVKLEAFKEYELNDVNVVADIYTNNLHDIVKTPIIPEGFSSSWAQYTVTLDNKSERDALQECLKLAGIPSMVYYPIAMHNQKAFANLNYKQGDFPVTEHLCDCVLSLPMHPYLTKTEIDTICKIIRDFRSHHES